MLETRVLSLGGEDALEEEMATHSSTLAWKIPWTEEPGRLQSMRLQSQTRLSNFTRQIEPGRLQSMGSQKNRTRLSDKTRQKKGLTTSHWASLLLVVGSAFRWMCCSALCPREGSRGTGLETGKQITGDQSYFLMFTVNNVYSWLKVSSRLIRLAILTATAQLIFSFMCMMLFHNVSKPFQ